MTLVEQRRGAVERGIIAVLWRERGLQIGGVVDGVRPGGGREKFVVVAETLAQIGAEAVIDGTAVGIIGVHVAERDAAGEADRTAIRVEARDGLNQSLSLGNATERVSAEFVGADDRRIHAAGAEKVHQGGGDGWVGRRCGASRAASADRERAGRRSLPR